MTYRARSNPSESSWRSLQMLARDEVKQQTKSLVVFYERLEHATLFGSIQVLFADSGDLLDAELLVVGGHAVFFALPHVVNAVSQDAHELAALISLLVLHQKVPLHLLALEVLQALLLDLHLHFLDLVEASDEVLFEERLYVVSDCFDSVSLIVDLAEVQLVLHEHGQSLVVVFGVGEISGTLAFGEWSLELMGVLRLDGHRERVRASGAVASARSSTANARTLSDLHRLVGAFSALTKLSLSRCKVNGTIALRRRHRALVRLLHSRLRLHLLMLTNCLNSALRLSILHVVECNVIIVLTLPVCTLVLARDSRQWTLIRDLNLMIGSASFD